MRGCVQPSVPSRDRSDLEGLLGRRIKGEDQSASSPNVGRTFWARQKPPAGQNSVPEKRNREGLTQQQHPFSILFCFVSGAREGQEGKAYHQARSVPREHRSREHLAPFSRSVQGGLLRQQSKYTPRNVDQIAIQHEMGEPSSGSRGRTFRESGNNLRKREFLRNLSIQILSQRLDQYRSANYTRGISEKRGQSRKIPVT